MVLQMLPGENFQVGDVYFLFMEWFFPVNQVSFLTKDLVLSLLLSKISAVSHTTDKPESQVLKVKGPLCRI